MTTKIIFISSVRGSKTNMTFFDQKCLIKHSNIVCKFCQLFKITTFQGCNEVKMCDSKISFSSQIVLFDSKWHFREISTQIVIFDSSQFATRKSHFRLKLSFSTQIVIFDSNCHFRLKMAFSTQTDRFRHN